MFNIDDLIKAPELSGYISARQCFPFVCNEMVAVNLSYDYLRNVESWFQEDLATLTASRSACSLLLGSFLIFCLECT